MKVIQLASGDLWAGAEVQLYSLATALRERADTEVEVVLLNHGELETRLRAAGVPVQVLDERRLTAVQIGWRLWRRFRRSRPDVVHTHRQKENVLGGVAAWLAGVPSLRTVHGGQETALPAWRLDKRLYRWLDRWCGRHLQRYVVAVSERLRADLAAAFPRRQLAVVDNGVDIERLAAEGASPAVLPGVAGRLRIAFVGRLVPVKRIDLFLRVARALQDTAPDAIDFYVLGDGPQRADCERMIGAFGLQTCVHMLGFRPDAARVLAAMDLLLMTSDHEGLPMTALEAMSLNVPVVAGAVGGLPEVLEHGRCGVLVREQRPDAYVAALRPLLDQPALRRDLAARAAARVRERYSAARNAAAYAELYVRAAQRGARIDPKAAASAK